MNLYLLVEGKSTEKKVYPAWIEYLLPQMSEVKQPNLANDNNYFIISGHGYPSILNVLKTSVLEINELQNFDYLILCLDSDENSVEEMRESVEKFINNEGIAPSDFEMEIIVQHRCFETWLLGNRRIFTHNPNSHPFIEYVQFYNVKENDPEFMGKYTGFTTHS